MKLEERLIVAVDFDPRKNDDISGVLKKVEDLAESLQCLGVVINVNSILRAQGYQLINDLHNVGLKVFADLKLIDISKTMEIDGAMLEIYKPDFLTVMCSSCIDGMHAVQNILTETKVLGVTILTSLNEEECQAIFTCSTKAGVLRFARMAKLAGLGELIFSPKEVGVVKDRFELQLGLNTPGIRPEWSLIEGG